MDKAVRDESITWLSSTTFATENKDLGTKWQTFYYKALFRVARTWRTTIAMLTRMAALPILRTQTLGPTVS